MNGLGKLLETRWKFDLLNIKGKSKRNITGLVWFFVLDISGYPKLGKTNKIMKLCSLCGQRKEIYTIADIIQGTKIYVVNVLFQSGQFGHF